MAVQLSLERDGILGFEPRFLRSERSVLPLDDIPTILPKRVALRKRVIL